MRRWTERWTRSSSASRSCCARVSRRYIGRYITAMRRLAALVFTLAALTPAHAGDVTVYAAASLKEALDAAAKAFEAKTKNHVVVSYGASNALARQIESGAPADVFL